MASGRVELVDDDVQAPALLVNSSSLGGWGLAWTVIVLGVVELFVLLILLAVVNSLDSPLLTFALVLGFILLNLLFILFYFRRRRAFEYKFEVDFRERVINLYRIKARSGLELRKQLSLEAIRQLALIYLKVDKGGESGAEQFFKLYVITHEESCYELFETGDYLLLLDIGELLAQMAGIEFKDWTEIEYRSEYDFLKFYKPYRDRLKKKR